MKNKLVPMPGIEKLEELSKRHKLIKKLEKLHRKQRTWEILTNDEQLDYDLLEKISIKELQEFVNILDTPW